MARTAWRYGDTVGGTAQGQVRRRDPAGRDPRATSPTRLHEAGLIGNPTVFRLYAGQRGVAGRFKAGRYEIVAPATPKQILDTLVKGAADELVSVVVPPGKNLLEIAELLDAAGVARQGRAGRQGQRSRCSPPSWGCRAPRWKATCSPTPTGCARARPPARALIPLVRRHRQVLDELRAAHAKGRPS